MKMSKRTISIMMIVCMLLTMIYGTGVVQAADGDYVDANSYMSSHVLKVDGQEYASGTLLDPSKEFALELYFSYNWDDISNNGYSYSYKLPEHVTIGDVASQAAPNILYNASQQEIGTYYYKDDVIYFTFNNNTGDQTAFFNLAANWEAMDNIGSITIPWNDGGQVVEFDSAHVFVSKNQIPDVFTLTEDGQYLKKYTITLQPKADYTGIAVNNVKLQDTFYGPHMYFAEEPDPSNPTHDICIKTYVADELTGTTWRDFSTADVTISGDYKYFTLTDIDIPANGKVVVEYYIIIPSEDKIELDATNASVYHRNGVHAIQEIYNASTDKTEVLKSYSEVTSWNANSSAWLLKEHGTAETIVDENEVEWNSIPYTISVNRYRTYCLGGSVTKDTISGFVGGEVIYDLDTAPYIESSKGWGTATSGDKDNDITTLNWVVLPYDQYVTLSQLTAPMSGTQLETLLTGSEYATFRSNLLKSINSYLGTKHASLTSAVVSNCVFTFDPDENTESRAAQPNFIWFSPLDTSKTPTAYFLHYNVMAEESVGSLSNGAEMWYTEYESGEVGGKDPWSNPKAMSVSKYNDGVYQGADGNYYVDWTIGITLPAGSGGFEQILLWDALQRYKNVPVGENGELYEVVDWLAGVSDGDFSAAYYFDDCNENAGSAEWRQYLRDFSDKIFTVSSTDKSVAVQTVVDRIHGAFFSKAWDYSYSSSLRNSSTNLNCTPHGFKFGGIHYSGDAVVAGQFTMDHEFESYGTVEIGDTVSPATLVFYIGDLPGTKTGYTINIEYTTQVNPALVAALPEILERDSLERVELTNVLWAHQGLPSGSGGYYLSPSNGEIAKVDSSYWLSAKDITPPVSKGVEYDQLNDYLDYTVVINPEKNLEVERTVYKIKDSLSLEGIKYVSNSFIVYDESGAVVYSKDSSKTAASKYNGLVTFSCTSDSKATNSFTMTFDNSTGAFEDTNGQFQSLTIVYSVDADAIPNKIVLENIVKLYGSLENSGTGEKVDTLLGTASTSCGPDSVLSKDVTNKPNAENNYKAQFAVVANLESKYADDYITSLEAGDVFTLTDTFEQNLSLDIDSIGVYYFNETTEKYVKMTSGYVLKYDDTEKTLSAEITVRSGVSKYKMEYAASIVGEQNAHTSFVNTAKIEGSSVAEVRFEDKIFKISYGAGAITAERVITLVKYDEVNLETRLQGAQFELYKLSDGSWIELTTPENNVPSLTTNVDGKVVISNSLSEVSQFVQDECWYKLVEVKSPAGYALDDTPIYYYVTDKEGKEPSVIPAGVVDYKVIDSAEGLVMVANDGLAIKLYKEDKIDGTALTGAAFSVYSNSACTNLLASSEAVSGENGAYLIDHIPVSSANATLYLKETKAPTGYTLDTTVYKITFENSQVKSIVSVDGTKTLNFSVEANGIELDYTNDATTGKLTISKEVIAKSDAAAAKSFTFTVKLTNASGTTLTANYAYTKFNADGTVAGTGTIRSGNTCTLTDGQSIMIKGLPAGAKYTVTETVNAEFEPYYNIKNYAGTYDFEEMQQGNVATGTIVAGDMDTVEFENRQYEEITVSALKILDAGTLEEQGKFEFELYNPAGQLVDTAVVDNQFGTAKFETPLKFYNTGTYNYKIKEKVPTDKPDYITYSTETITAKIVVTLDSSGNLKATVTYSGGTGTSNNAITNKYSATGSITFVADKLINGKSDSEFMTAGAFEFEIREGSALVATGKNDASGNIVFSGIEYELNGTTDNTGRHTYTVSEKSKTVKGWTYDDDTYTVVVDVTDNYDGTLNVSVVSGATKSGNNYAITPKSGKDAAFENTYEASASLNFRADKVLDGRTLAANQFEFAIYEGTTLIDTAKNTANGTITFDAIEFYRSYDGTDEETYLGTHTYTIKEVIPSPKVGGYTYDGTTYTVKVTATDDGKGNITLAVTGATKSGSTSTYDVNVSAGKDAAFENSYSAEGSIIFVADKLVNNDADHEFMTAGAFEFEIREGSTVVATGKNDANGNVTFSAIKYVRNSTTDDVKTHTYTVVEKSGTLKGWTYDDDSYTVTVTVTDNNNGTLTARAASGATASGSNYKITPKSGKDAAFENKYEVSEELVLMADKILEGRTLAANQFEFAVYEGTTVVATGKNTADGTIKFTPIEFYRTYDGTTEKTYLGTHTYTIKEVIPSPKVGGYTYDTASYTVKVTATDNGKGDISFTVTGASATSTANTYEVTPTSGKNAVFVNEYAAEGSIVFTADKYINGMAGFAFMKAGAFQFQILDENDNVVAKGETDDDGKIVFSAIEYVRNSTTDNVGTHTYTVVEKTGTLKGWTYDDSEYTVVVKVTDNNNGTLTAVATSGATASGSNYKITPKSGKDAAFENKYEVSEELVLMADKILEGRTLAANQFEFAVYEGTTVVATGKNTADGTIKFTPIEFYRTYDGTTEKTYLGTHTYTIKEVIPSPKVGGYTYDETVYTVTVVATDDGKGDISFTVTGASATSTANTYEVTPTGDKEAVFINSYEAEGKIVFTADKIINGRTDSEFMAEGAFRFQILDENDKVVAEGETDDDGNIEFSEMWYYRNPGQDDVGTHTYTVVEVDGGVDGWTYSGDSYTVVVKVTDNNNGTLTAVATSGATASGNNFAITPATGNAAVFENKYEVSEELVFNASKILLGRVIEDEQFRFAIYEGDEVVATGKNDVDGNIKFTPIKFYRSYDGTIEKTYLGEHTYTIKEVIPSPKVGGYTYDETVYTVTVVATDDGKGDISFVVTGATLDGEVNNYVIDVPADQEANFINYYEAEGFITFEGIKDLTGRTQDEGEFSFIITEYKIVGGERVATGKVFSGTNTADGEIIFDEIKYVQNKDINETGSYVYEVVEFIPADEDKRGGVTYDDVTRYEVETVVVDNGDGTLGITPTDNYVELDFFNEYDATGYIDISATKHILTSYDSEYNDMSTDGVDMENVFEFSIYEYVNVVDEVGQVLGVEEVLLETIYVKPGETIDFTTIEYHIWDVREHVYKIVENRTGNAGYGFDTYEYIFVVSLADNRDGTLAVAITDEYGVPVGVVDINQANCSVEFTNKYNATGSTYLTGTKDILNADQMLENGELVDDEFSFTVYEGIEPFTEETLVAEDMIVATGLSKADGTIEFTELWYDISMLGTHYYAIYEDSEVGVNNVLNTAKFVNVTVEVKNNGDGTLDVIVEYSRDGEILETAQFTNEATEVEITKKDTKGQVLPGAELEILDAEGNVVFEFVSTEESQKVYGLAVETVYTLHEAKAPDGYVLADDISFMVDAEGNTVIIESETKQSVVTSIIMVDELIPEAPATGDESHVFVMILLTVLSLATSVLVYMKKKEEEK